jgi:hypothetical protein
MNEAESDRSTVFSQSGIFVFEPATSGSITTTGDDNPPSTLRSDPMNKAALVLTTSAISALFGALVVAETNHSHRPQDDGKKPPMIGHMVFFSLNEPTPENKAKMIEACKRHLSGHEGTIYFSAGVICDSLKREVNDRDFDVALHLVFADLKAHDKYQDHPRHLEFIEGNKALWKKVRVFDSEIAAEEAK